MSRLLHSGLSLCLMLLLLGLGQGAMAQKDLFKSDFAQGLRGWHPEYGGEWKVNDGVLEGKTRPIAAGEASWENYRLMLQARLDEPGEDGQIWISVRYRDAWNRYALAIRDGELNDILLLKYQENDSSKPPFSINKAYPLGFEPGSGIWYPVRIEVSGGRIRAWVGETETPQVDYTDPEPLAKGRIALGGSWHLNQFKDVLVETVPRPSAAKQDDGQAKQLAAKRETERLARKKDRRAAYQAVSILANEGRTSVSLTGTWLFLPGYEVKKEIKPESPEMPDQDWHVIHVPDFWNPIGWWIYNGHGFRTVSEAFVHNEERRVGENTFDPARTNEGWYRQWIELPQRQKGQCLRVNFGAAASYATVYLNGREIGRHAGFFAPFELDLTDAAKWGGKNLLAVHVVGLAEKKNRDKVQAVAVSMAVTEEMTNSLPQGMYGAANNSRGERVTTRCGGLWQPVTLSLVSSAFIDDVFFKPHTDGAELEVTIKNRSEAPFEGEASVFIRERHNIPQRIKLATGGYAVRPSVEKIHGSRPVKLAAGGKAVIKIHIDMPGAHLWTPAEPNLYFLRVQLQQGGKVLDNRMEEVGFRTFEVKGRDFVLNGRKTWLGGADMPPHGLRPNDAALAGKFMKLMHEGNQLFTRMHASPFTPTWCRAADRAGVAVSFEGTWPWLAIGQTELPSPELVKAWQAEMVDLVRSLRNHPSIVMWTVSNENYFFDERYGKENMDHDSRRRAAKWKIFSDTIKAIRKADPTRPVCLTSGFCVSDEVLKAASEGKFDYGDINDLHHYKGWYETTVWKDKYYGGQYIEQTSAPMICQEASTGYPNDDTGHSERWYMGLYVPQGWVGDEAYDDRAPSVFKEHYALVTKEMLEDVRRSRRSSAWMAFANCCWFRHVTDARLIEPYPVYEAAKLALADVLVSLDQRQRHWFAGETFMGSIVVVNDQRDGNELEDLVCRVRLVDSQGKALSQGETIIPDCPYFGKVSQPFSLAIPAELPNARGDYRLELELCSGGKTVSRNEYKLLIASREWAMPALRAKTRAWVGGERAGIEPLLKSLKVEMVAGLAQLGARGMAIWLGKKAPGREDAQGRELLEFARQGGRVLLLETGAAEGLLAKGTVGKYEALQAEFTNIEEPGNVLFAGLGSQDIKWWNNAWPYVTNGAYVIGEKSPALRLGEMLYYPGYAFKGPKRYPLFEVGEGKGRILVSELATSCWATDPLSARLLRNMVAWGAGESQPGN